MQRFDFVLSPVSPATAFAAEQAMPTDDPAHPFEHIAFTLPFNMSEQPAASINAGYGVGGLPIGSADRRPSARRPRRAAPGACLGAAARDATAVAGRPCFRHAKVAAMTQHDARGLPVGSRSIAARAAVDVALWRMMSFYDTPIADLDAAIAADAGWALPHTMKAGFLASLTEASLLSEARHPPGGRARVDRRECAGARTAPISKPPQQVLEGRWAGGLPHLGRTLDRTPARRAGAAVGAAVGLLPR